MFQNIPVWLRIVLSFALSFGVSFLMTPRVKNFAERVGAIDVPKDARRIHDHPIPRMGGLAIFCGFLMSVIVFVSFSPQIMGIMLGALIIAGMGAVDDIVCLNAWVKLAIQILAALVAMRCGVMFRAISNPNFLSLNTTIPIGWLAFPLTIIWIVGCTNAVNLIDGLDGLAVGVSAISSFSMLIVSMFVSDPNTQFLLAALCGACIGFMPYNINPAKIFMGDVGSQFLGYVLATTSIIGLFKLHTLITFLVPVLAMAIPLADTIFAFCRRILHGQSPFQADKKHFHHRLMALGLSQKQAVAVLYGVSAVMGLIGVLLAQENEAMRIICMVAAFVVSISVWLFVFWRNPNLKKNQTEDEKNEASAALPPEKGKADDAEK
ncbi:MAG: MraY family glycosyltransferase [Eubacteriales bacterium]|nr:MraY family glycosyltransferase [Eubacteriales bacterium]